MLEPAAVVLGAMLCCPMAVLAAQAPTTAEVTSAINEAYEGLPRLLKIAWREGPEYPMGIQDSAFGDVDGKIISGGGFSRHPKDVVAQYPDAFDGQPSGFTKLTFLFDLGKPNTSWIRIADAPGPPRQAAATAVVGSDFYMIGGFSYSEPRTYASTYRLRSAGGRWTWEKLHCDLPWPISEAAVAVVGDKIYLIGGADFCALPGQTDADFNSKAGRSGQPVGRALLMLDTKRIDAGWQRLQDLPGSPRFDVAGGAAGGKVYALGGVHRAKTDKYNGYHNVVDSWVYDPQSAQWSRLPDAPQGANRRVVAYKDRYLILLGGYRYATTWHPDGTVSEVLRPHEKALADMKDHIESTVLVFDTRTNQFGTSDPLVDKSSFPMAVIRDDTIYTLGGEGGYRLWHPATFQIGKITRLDE